MTTAATRRRIVWLLFVGATFVAAAAAAQSPGGAGTGLVINLGSFFSIAGLGLGGSALIAWGRQGNKIEEYDARLARLEDDRVTRAEHLTMQSDIREIRRALERRGTPRDGGGV